MNGFLVIDKPAGITSNDVVRQVRRALRLRRVGHCGTLDPLATGVLPVAIGEATRLVEFVMDGDKCYRATLQLGSETDTQDAEGAILATAPFDGVDPAAIEAAVQQLLGRIEQIPPMYSALKRDGVPLYRLARQGVEVERAPRTVTIHRLTIIAVDLPLVTFEVTCSKGTYVRTLAHDLGRLLGCGAHLTALRRLRSGTFDLASAIPLAQLTDDPQQLLSMDAALQGWPEVVLPEIAVQRLRHGIPPALDAVTSPVALQPETPVKLMADGMLLAVARFAPLRETEARGDFELLRVFLH